MKKQLTLNEKLALDIRLKELNETRKLRPLNVLERIMVKQIVNEIRNEQ